MFRIAFAFFLVPACIVRALAGAPPDFGFGLNGSPIRDLAGPGVRVVILIFAASDCPISNRYVPDIARLSKEFSPNARIWWVFPNPGDTATVVAQHNRDFAIHEDTALDPRQELVERAHASTTPEAAVFVVHGTDLDEVYRGRIDDRYISLGQERPQPQHHDLEAAIRAALAGKPAPQPGGPPVGCSIVFLQK
ncbi:MAG: hypothetical protein WBE76_06220 [Terracidiphilus sp.]